MMWYWFCVGVIILVVYLTASRNIRNDLGNIFNFPRRNLVNEQPAEQSQNQTKQNETKKDETKVSNKTAEKVAPKKSVMSKLIEVINKLQEACGEVNDDLQYDLPQIAVVGCQSAGKSSVLENIVGKDFLPRGTGVVTRRPLILQLIHQLGEEYGEFSHNKGEKYTDFSKIRDEIAADTDRVAGTSKGLSKEPIGLRIYSPNVPNLTLIDLPGLTKVPIGDQPDDIEQQIREMILDFIRKENCLILAVTPANTDLANSDALKLARVVDESGERTIGVITKCDLMDRGTDCRDILDNKVFPLQRGYVGVVNRSQMDIQGNKSIQHAQKVEANFFADHDKYKSIAKRLGTPHLQLVLSTQLAEHIRKNLPALQDKLEKQKISIEEEIKQLKESLPTDDMMMIRILGIIIDQLKTDFKKEIGDHGAESIETERLSLGTQINKVFFDSFPNLLLKITCDKEDLREKIDHAIRNINGIRPCLNTPHMAFESIVREEISRLKEPIRQCVELVAKLLLEAVRMSIRRIERFPKIRDYVEHCITTHVYAHAQERENSVLALLDMEIAFQNTNHDDFQPNNDVERQGMLSIDGNGSSKPFSDAADDIASFWFVLTSNKLICYYNEYCGQEKFTLRLDAYQMRANGNNNRIVLNELNSNGESHQQIKLYCEDDTAFEAWKASFECVFNKNLRQQGSMKFKRDVSECHEKVTKYMAIVKKTARDMVPKAIKLYIIDNLNDYIQKDLAPLLLNPEVDKAVLFEIEPEQIEDLDRKKKMLATYKSALAKIRSIPV